MKTDKKMEDCGLVELLATSSGFNAFQNYLMNEFSNENLTFFVEVTQIYIVKL